MEGSLQRKQQTVSAEMGAVYGGEGAITSRGGEVGGVTRKRLKIKGDLVQGHKGLTDRILGCLASSSSSCALCV